VTPYVSQEEVMEIKMAFDLFDLDHGGSIDPKGTPIITQNSRRPSTPSASRPRQRPSTR
jgi:hypothetical protein